MLICRLLEDLEHYTRLWKTLVDALALNGTFQFYIPILSPDITWKDSENCRPVASSRLVDFSLLVRSRFGTLNMPPRGLPHKLRVPNSAKTHLVYDLSAGNFERDWTEDNSVELHPLVVQCYSETYDGKNCKHCNYLHKPCEPVRCRYGLCLLSAVIGANIACLRSPRVLKGTDTNSSLASLGPNS